MASSFFRYGLVFRHVSPSGSSPLVSTGCGFTSPCGRTATGTTAANSPTARSQDHDLLFSVLIASTLLVTPMKPPLPPRADGPGRERRRCATGSGSLLRQLEGPQAAALRDVLVHLGHLAAPQRDRAAPAGDHGHVLLAVLLPGDGRADDAGAGVELPQLLAGLGVEGLQVALGGPGEDQAAVGGEDAAPVHAPVVSLPDDLPGGGLDGLERADVVLEHRLDDEAGAQVGRPLLVGDGLVPDVHAPLVGRDVEQVGVLAVGHRVPVLAAQEVGDGPDDGALLAVGALGGVAGPVAGLHRAAGGEVDL